MTLSFPTFSFSALMHLVGAPVAPRKTPVSDAGSDHDGIRAEREFWHEMMRKNPEGFQSEQGLMAVMNQYPYQF